MSIRSASKEVLEWIFDSPKAEEISANEISLEKTLILL
jgi:hypothetical protein